MVKKKIFVTGSGGLVGSRFVELQKNNFYITALEIDVLNLLNKKAVEKCFNENLYDAIVHFAAFTDVSQAEKQRGNKHGICWRVNVNATKNLINSIDPEKTHFIHISTDMVFSGSEKDPGPYTELHHPESDSGMITWYGYTKSQAEKIVQHNLEERCTILRLIYPVRAKFENKLDYLRKPLRLLDEGKLYPLFYDQRISISYIDEACDALKKIINGRKFGIFHVSSPDTTSPHEIVRFMVNKLRKNRLNLKKISLDEVIINPKDKVRYPKFGGLNVSKSEKELGIHYLPWKRIVERLVHQGIGE